MAEAEVTVAAVDAEEVGAAGAAGDVGADGAAGAVGPGDGGGDGSGGVRLAGAAGAKWVGAGAVFLPACASRSLGPGSYFAESGCGTQDCAVSSIEGAPK